MHSILVGMTGLVLLGAAAACSASSGGERPLAAEPSASASPEGSIPQPTTGRLEVARDADRVDLAMPRFSDPTDVDNPLFPVARGDSNLLLGTVDGRPFRTEVTVLDEPRIVKWRGARVETLVSQYTAYLAGRIHEVADDFYAQADDGSVWYFGEEVSNFDDGVVADTEGTWLAGKDGPAAMIMPASPQAGDVYRPENIPGNVFEEVTVARVGDTVRGPSGPVTGAVQVRELHMDGTSEDKTFAPGYGEFYTGGGGDVEALALAVPTDRLTGPVPRPLSALTRQATAGYDAAVTGQDTSTAINRLAAAWAALRGTPVPPLVEAELDRVVSGLGRPHADVARAALTVSRLATDLQLRHVPRAHVDAMRLELWARQLVLDVQRHDTAGTLGDLAGLDLVRERVKNHFPSLELSEVDQVLGRLRAAVLAWDAAAAARADLRLREAVGRLAPR